MTEFNLFKKPSGPQKNSLSTTLEELKKDARSIVEIRTELTAQIWKLNIQINKCNDPVKVELLRAELKKGQTALHEYQPAVLLDNIKNKEIEEFGDSRVGRGSPFLL